MDLLDKFLRITGKNDSPPTNTDLEQEVSSVEASDNNLEHEFEKLKNAWDEQQSADQKLVCDPFSASQDEHLCGMI